MNVFITMITVSDAFGRTISTTDAAGNTTTTEYCADSDLPAKVTDALGNSTCYAYDARGRKSAEWGTAIQPACFGYDEADRLISLTTFRATGEVIDTDPRTRSDGDTTTWKYHDATGLELCKTYADGSQVSKTYDAFNRLETETDARGIVLPHSYDSARGLQLGTTYSDGSTPRSYAYNHLGQLTQVTDDAGTRTLSYNSFGEKDMDELLADGITHIITELRDKFGRSTGYIYVKNGEKQQTVNYGYAADGRTAFAGFVHGGAPGRFEFSYLSGSNLLEKLTHPSGITLTQSYEEHRDLLTQMAYHRGDTLVAQRTYTYDALGRPTQRNTARNGGVMHDTFAHNSRSELVNAQVNGEAYSYAYDNIGNRESAQEAAEEATRYEANALNQYTAVGDFTPAFDLAGNQTLVKTSTGIWRVTYNAQNRPTTFISDDGSTVVECAYDYMGRRCYKKVTTNGEVTLHQRYIYRGYLQIACCDLTRSWQPALWYILWDPTQATATRPLAIQKDGTWYTYGWDLTKNICEIYDPNAFIRTTYTYSPYGSVTADGDATQPIQWSSEFYDTELGLVYYNYRYYNTLSGMWISRDPANEVSERNLYTYATRRPHIRFDQLGLWLATRESKGKERRVYLKMSENDTDETLAKEVGLDKETIHIWGKKVCGYILKNKEYCGYSVPNVWVTANLIDNWVRIGGAFGIATSRLVQWSTKLIVAKNLEEFMNGITEDLWGFIVYAHGVHLKDSSPDDLGKKKPDGAYYDGDISAITRSGYTVRYRQLDLIEDILAATKGRRIAEAHLMQCYSFRDKYIVQQWRRAAVISKGYTRMNACGFNIPLT